MIGKLFDLEGNRIVIKEVCYQLAPLKDIIDFYPEEHYQVMLYLHYKVSLNPADNPFADIAEDEKDIKILKYLNLDIESDGDIIKDALECVKQLYETTIYRSYKSLKTLLDRINTDITNIQMDYHKDGNAQNVINVVKNLGIIKKELKEAQKDYKDEIGDMRGRGGLDFSYDEFDQDDDLELD